MYSRDRILGKSINVLFEKANVVRERSVSLSAQRRKYSWLCAVGFLMCDLLYLQPLYIPYEYVWILNAK